MPASTVTVRAAGSSAITLSIALSESRLWVLSAMLLKQCRVPSTFRLLCFLTNSRTCSREVAGYRFCVLYSRLPAQFVSFSPDAQESKGAIRGLANSAGKSFIKVLFFMARVYRDLPGLTALAFHCENGGHCTPVLAQQRRLEGVGSR